MAKNTTSLLSTLSDALRSARDDVTALRGRRLAIVEQIDSVRAAPVTDAEIVSRVDRVLDAAEREARNRASFSLLAARASRAFDLDAALAVSPLGVLSLLGQRESITERLVAEAKTARNGTPLSDAAREAEIERLQRELEDIERAEESAIREAEAAGAAIPRRADANPAIFLLESLS